MHFIFESSQQRTAMSVQKNHFELNINWLFSGLENLLKVWSGSKLQNIGSEEMKQKEFSKLPLVLNFWKIQYTLVSLRIFGNNFNIVSSISIEEMTGNFQTCNDKMQTHNL